MSDGTVTRSTGRRVLNAMGRAAVSIWNDSRTTRIEKIDEEIEELQKERARLTDELIDLDKESPS